MALRVVASYVPHMIQEDPPPAVPYAGLPFGAWVGGDTALATDDEDGSYVEASTGSTFVRQMTTQTWRMVKVSGTDPAPPVDYSYDWVRYTISWAPFGTQGGSPVDQAVTAGFVPYKPGYGYITSGIPSVAAVASQANDGYLSVVSAPFIYAEDAAVITDPDVVWVIGNMGDTSFTPNVATIRLSYLRMDLLGEGETYLRNHSRDDGLGANAPRNHGATSKQGSLRNRGYR